MFLALIPDMILVPLPESTSTPSSGEVVYFPPSPQPTQTSLSPTIILDTAIPPIPNPTEFVYSYWPNVSGGRYENAWVQLSPVFRQAKHNNDYPAYVWIPANESLPHHDKQCQSRQQDNYSAIVEAHLAYYTGAYCNSSEYNFEMWLVYDGASNSWFFDKNIVRD